MIREVDYNGIIIEYELIRKKVKNVNLRVRQDGSVVVSAGNRVPTGFVDDFVKRKAPFVLDAIEKYKTENLIAVKPLYSPESFISLVNNHFDKTFELFKEYKISKPTLKFRKMKSRWGSCNFKTCAITLSTNLIYCTEEQIRYVIIHEYSHLLVHDHSKAFYDVVGQFCPDYKRIRKEMNKLILR